MTELTRELWATDGGHRAIDQHAFSLFISSGALDRHLRRSRQAYRARQLKLVDRLTSEIPDARIDGIAAGLHFVLRLPEGTCEGDVVSRLKEGGIFVRGLTSYQLAPLPSDPALVIGYGSLVDAAIPDVATQIAGAVRDAQLLG
jgi:GntR family transcriptional regulator/MocR family aminotransferase